MRALALAWVFILACSTDPLEVVNEREIVPTEEMVEAYLDAAECIGATGFVEDVTWMKAEGIRYDGRSVSGLWVSPHTIYLAEGLDPATEAQVVGHEALHDILQTRDHHDPRWRLTCDPRGAYLAGRGIS